MHQWITADDDEVARASAEVDPWPISQSPDRLMLAVAGGNHPTHCFWMQSWGPKLRHPHHRFAGPLATPAG